VRATGTENHVATRPRGLILCHGAHQKNIVNVRQPIYDVTRPLHGSAQCSKKLGDAFQVGFKDVEQPSKKLLECILTSLRSSNQVSDIDASCNSMYEYPFRLFSGPDHERLVPELRRSAKARVGQTVDMKPF
jgi:hypothetical protein